MIGAVVTNGTDLLRAALGRAGLRYALRRTDNGRVYAGFRVVGEGGDSLGFTASARSGSLELSVHGVIDIDGDEEGLRWLHDLTREWRFGRLHRSTTDGCRASIGLFAPELPPSGEAMLGVVGVLRGVAAGMRAAESAAARPAWHDLEGADGLNGAVPRVEADRSLTLVTQLMASAGFTFRAASEGEPVTAPFVSDAGHRYVVGLRVADARFLEMCVDPNDLSIRLDGAVLQRINEINGRLALGSVTVPGTEGPAAYVVRLPIAWTQLDERLCSWLIERAWVITDMLHEELT